MSLAPDVVTVAVSRADGGLTVVRVIENEYSQHKDHLTGEMKVRTKHYDITPQYVDDLIAKYGWTGNLSPVSWEFVPNDFVDEVTDRIYRNAWRHTPGNKKPGHDIVKARDLHRDILRRDRQKQLDDLDLAYTRADEAGDQQQKRDVAAQKQKLRDVTADPRIESAQTVEELKLLTLTNLL